MPNESAECLLIAYDFSTKIMGGSVRFVKFAQYLPAQGWTPHVLTASPPDEHPDFEGTATHIASPERGYGGGIAVDTAGTSVLGQNPGWMRRLAFLKSLLPLERQVTWFPNFFREAVKAAEGRDIRAVVSTSAPYVVMILGHWLAKRLGVPHIVDIRDDWRDRFTIEKRSWFNRTILDAYAGFILRRAEAITTVSGPIVERLRMYGRPVHLLTNGYDEADFAAIPLDTPTISPEGPLRIMHLGWLGDFRSIAPLLDAVRRLRERDPSVDIEIEQYGLIEPGQVAAIEASGLAARVTVHAQVPHAEAIRRMARADVLLVIPGSGIPAALTGKIFEYLRARRPILLWAGDGAAFDLATDVGLRWRVKEGDHDALIDALDELVADKRAGRLRTHTDAAAARAFARDALTARLARLLDAVTGRGEGDERAESAEDAGGKPERGAAPARPDRAQPPSRLGHPA